MESHDDASNNQHIYDFCALAISQKDEKYLKLGNFYKGDGKVV